MDISKDTIISALEAIASHFAGIEERSGLRFVFVGGVALPLYADKISFDSFVTTKDLDVVVSMVTHDDFRRVSQVLSASGLVRDRDAGTPVEEALPFRWWYQDRLMIDILSTDFEVGGNVARWFKAAWKDAFRVRLPSGQAVWLADPAAFLASKLDAFLDRGIHDPVRSKDLGEILCLLATRSRLKRELELAPPNLAFFISAAMQAVSELPDFDYTLSERFLGDPETTMRVLSLVTDLRDLAKRIW